jgi:hypothetical protein
MGTSTVKRKVRYLLFQGWYSLDDLDLSKNFFEEAHLESSDFVRLHTCAHASLFVHALLRKDRLDIQRELWLMFAAGPVTLRDRFIRFARQSPS